MRKLIILCTVLIFIHSCKKDENGIHNDEHLTLMPQAIGNYWIYEHYKVDTSGNETLLHYKDSIIITSDTLIRNNKYYVLEGIEHPGFNTWETIGILRDSSGYLVNENGEKLVSENNFTDTLLKKNILTDDGDTLYTISLQMEETDEKITVPAGTFSASNCIHSFEFTSYLEGGVSKKLNNYYASNVGQIIKSYAYASSHDHIEKRLVKYFQTS